MGGVFGKHGTDSCYLELFSCCSRPDWLLLKASNRDMNRIVFVWIGPKMRVVACLVGIPSTRVLARLRDCMASRVFMMCQTY